MKNLFTYKKLLLLCLMASCKFVDINPPTDKVITGTLFQEERTATAAVLGLYTKLSASSSIAAGTITLFAGLSADEFYIANPSLSEYIQFQNNQLSIGNSLLYSNFWRTAYDTIYQANACLEGLNNTTTLSANTKQQLMGECYFIRAFCYWYLVNLFGDVPLAITSDYLVNRLLARSSTTQVKQQILADLLEARKLLPPTYPSAGKVRANYFTVQALLARYYLYEGNWPETERLCTEILQSPLYMYETDINKIFLISGTESIWQLQIDAATYNSIEGLTFIPNTTATAIPNQALTTNMLTAFEANDLRQTAWIGKKTVAGVTYAYPFKYKIRLDAAKTENLVVFRLAELYLNRAEAYAHLGKPQDALDDLNVLRRRANLGDRTQQNTPDVFAAIQQERRIELFAEWGNRWFDLRRTGKIDAVLGAIKPNWTTTAAWFPIPNLERTVNPNLSQNDGYTK